MQTAHHRFNIYTSSYGLLPYHCFLEMGPNYLHYMLPVRYDEYRY